MQLHFLEERKVELYNVNHRPEGRGEEWINALDLAFLLDIHKDELLQVVKNPEEFQRSFWNDKQQLIQEITELKFSTPKTEDQCLKIRSQRYNKPITFAPATVTIKKGEPRDGGIMRIVFAVAVYPTVQQIGKMCDTCTASRECQITLEDWQARSVSVDPDPGTDNDYPDK